MCVLRMVLTYFYDGCSFKQQLRVAILHETKMHLEDRWFDCDPLKLGIAKILESFSVQTTRFFDTNFWTSFMRVALVHTDVVAFF